MGDKRVVRRGLVLGEVEVENVRRPALIAIGGEGGEAYNRRARLVADPITEQSKTLSNNS